MLELSLGFYQGFVVLCNSTKSPLAGFIFGSVLPVAGGVWLHVKTCLPRDPQDAFFTNLLFAAFSSLLSIRDYPRMASITILLSLLNTNHTYLKLL